MRTQHIDTDVLVVGGGGSGLAAAIEAATAGRDVVLIEKNAALGGTTAWSIGSFSASCTADQRREGIEDDPWAHYEDMGKFAGSLDHRDNHAMRKILADESGETLEWLRALGVTFFGPVAEPPHRVPRMHNVLPNSMAYIYHLARKARSLGVRILTGTLAERLLIAEGRVDGVEAISRDGRAEIRARRGVVLAGGDYSASSELKEKFGAHDVASVPPINDTATGDCHRMILAVGGRVLNGDVSHGPIIRFVPPPRVSWIQRVPPWTWLMRIGAWGLRTLPPALLRPIILNFVTTALGPEQSLFAHGATLVGTDGSVLPLDGKSSGEILTSRPDNAAYILLDAALAAKFSAWPHFVSTAPGVAYAYFPDYRRSRPDLLRSANDLADLKPTAAFDGARLKREIGDLQADPDCPIRISQGPFHLLGPVKAFVPSTDGGVAVDTSLQVLDSEDRPIEGLYAAGSTGQGGLLLMGHGHHIGWAFVSGRIAGRNAAARRSR